MKRKGKQKENMFNAIIWHCITENRDKRTKDKENESKKDEQKLVSC